MLKSIRILQKYNVNFKKLSLNFIKFSSNFLELSMTKAYESSQSNDILQSAISTDYGRNMWWMIDFAHASIRYDSKIFNKTEL